MKNFFVSLFTSQIIKKIVAPERFVLITLLSFTAWLYFYVHGLTLAYNDAMSHLNLSRMVIDNLQPGLAQLGGVWLPFSHLLPLLLIWNDWAWHSGFSGSLFSMMSYAISFWAIFKIVYILTKKYIAAIVAGLVFALNLNMLYLQSTPLTESLYIGLFSLSALSFTLFITRKDSTKYLLALGVLGFFQVITRYDGWFVVAIEALLIAIFELLSSKTSINQTIGKLFIFCMPVALGIGLWIIWNQLIFNDPFFFALGPYSAHSQQQAIASSSGLITKGSIFYSTLAYGYTMLHNIGTYILFFSVIGITTFFRFVAQQLSQIKKTLIILFLITPIFFNILALFLGFSIVNVPELNWNPSGNPEGQWFNVRYGILALPAIAVFLGFLASWKKLTVIFVLALIILQTYVMSTKEIVTITDGTKGSSAFNADSISKAIETRVKPNDKVLMSIYSFNPVAFKSGIQLKQIIHEGLNKEWPLALEAPQKYAKWVVIANSPGDPLYDQFIEKNKNKFLAEYKLDFTSNNSSIYKLKQ